MKEGAHPPRVTCPIAVVIRGTLQRSTVTRTRVTDRFRERAYRSGNWTGPSGSWRFILSSAMRSTEAMRVVVYLEHRFERTPDGRIWTRSSFPYAFWTRYLDTFERVTVVARAQDRSTRTADTTPVEGPHVEFAPLPHYHGPLQFLAAAPRVANAALRAAGGPGDAVIMRVSSPVASLVVPYLRARHRPFGLEVVGDPHDVFAPGGVAHPLRPIFRWWYTRELRGQCMAADAVAYVTASGLEPRYPPRPDTFRTEYSSIELPPNAFIEEPRSARRIPTSPFRLVTVASLAQRYKGIDVLLGAMEICVRGGYDLDLTVVGEGRHRVELEDHAARLALSSRVHFVGELPRGKAVRTRLDAADLFVLPSRAEGLPRAMIEAMARGLPCLGTSVGGIPDLLPPADMVPPGNTGALAKAIISVVSDRERQATMSQRNWNRATQYRDDVLQERRIAFYRHLRERTAERIKR